MQNTFSWRPFCIPAYNGQRTSRGQSPNTTRHNNLIFSIRELFVPLGITPDYSHRREKRRFSPRLVAYCTFADGAAFSSFTDSLTDSLSGLLFDSCLTDLSWFTHRITRWMFRLFSVWNIYNWGFLRQREKVYNKWNSIVWKLVCVS